MVGVLILAVAVFAVWIAVPLFPSAISSGSTAALPVGGRTDVATPGGNDPGLVHGQPAAPPGALAGPDRGPIPVSEARHNLTAVHRGGGLLVAASQPGPAAQPSRPGEAANGADLGQQAAPPAGEHVPRRAAQPAKPAPAEQVPPREPKPPADQPPVNPVPKPKPQREQLEAVARELAKLQQGRNGDGQPASRPQNRPASGGANVVRPQGGQTNSNSPKQSKTGSGGGGKQGGSAQPGGGSTSSSSSTSK